jgi:beta-galactosidase
MNGRNGLWSIAGGIVAVLLALQFAFVRGAEKQNAAASVAQPADFYPLAVWYGGGKARAPMLEPVDTSSAERWGKDLDQIKAVGFNTVKCWVDWATAEPKSGEFDFRNLDLLMRSAQERGLRVIVQVYLDSAPDWVGEEYPDGRFVDRSGAVINSEAAPGFCIDHAGVRREIVKFLAALSKEANQFPALYGWDCWSEPHVVNWAEFPSLNNPEFCYCPSSEARFREWLKQKYGTLEALNAAWYRRFERWDQIEPPRASTILSYTDYLDWRAFIEDKLAGDLRTRVDAIRSADSTHPITSHAAAPELFTSPTDGFGEPDDFKMSANADAFGTSLYPKHAESTHPWSYEMLDAGLDFTRSAGHSLGKGFWIGELQAGQGVTGMRIAEPVDSHDEEFWLWQAVAHGAKEIAIYAWYPMNSGYESNGYGLINLDGTLTSRAHAAGEVAKDIESAGSDLLAAQPAQAQVAVLFNRLSYMVGGSESSLSKLGNATRDSLMGLHRAFLQEQIPVDFVDPADVLHDRLGRYKILFLPFPVMISKSVTEGITRFIEHGGTVVAEARLAWNDARGFSSDEIPGMGLAKVFGAREKVMRPVEKPQIVRDPNPGQSDWASGTKVVADAFEEDLEPLPGAHVLAHFEDGAPAIVENRCGKGKAVLVGSFLAMSYERHQEQSAKQVLLSLARDAGVKAEVTVSGDNASQLEVRRLVSDRLQFLFAFNRAGQAIDAKITVDVPWTVGEAHSLNDKQPVVFSQSNGRVTFAKQLPANGIWVIRYTRK